MWSATILSLLELLEQNGRIGAAKAERVRNDCSDFPFLRFAHHMAKIGGSWRRLLQVKCVWDDPIAQTKHCHGTFKCTGRSQQMSNGTLAGRHQKRIASISKHCRDC